MASVHLLRRLGFKESFAIVVGSIIGTGIFLKTAVMAQDAGSPFYVLLALLTAGVLSYIGALIYAELGCLFPAAGGEYVFLREAYGPLTGFLFGWTRFWIASPGSIAAYAIGAVTFLDSFLPMTNHRIEMAIAIIVFFTVLNCFSVQFGGAVQTVMTAVKILMIFGLAASILTFGAGTSWYHLSGAAISVGWKSWSGFGLAVLAALWAFDGWNNLSMAAGEIRDPDRVIPQSLAWGLIAVLFLYVGANLAYFYALPFEEVVNSHSTLYPDALPVATKAALHSFGSAAVAILSLAFVFSALGAMNGTILTGARVPYAMARDGLMWSWLGEANARTHSRSCCRRSLTPSWKPSSPTGNLERTTIHAGICSHDHQQAGISKPHATRPSNPGGLDRGRMVGAPRHSDGAGIFRSGSGACEIDPRFNARLGCK